MLARFWGHLCFAGLLAALSLPQESAASNVQEGYFDGAGDIRLFYRMLTPRSGNARDPIVFLHGGPGLSIEDGGYSMDPLSKQRTLLMFDQRGGGRSELVNNPALLTAAHEVEDLEALRVHFGIKRMSLIGLSWGSGLAALYADAHPERIARIVFLSPMPPASKPFVQQRNNKMKSLFVKEDNHLRDLDQQKQTATDDRIQALCRESDAILSGGYVVHPEKLSGSKWDTCNVSPAAIRNQSVVGRSVVDSLGEFDLRPGLARLNVPALVIEGANTAIPLDATEEWAKAAPQARLLLIPDAGHANFVDHPEIVLREIGTFLNGKWPASAKMLSH